MTKSTEKGNSHVSAVRLPAEWEGRNAVMISWPHEDTDWAPMLGEVESCYDGIVEIISRYAPVVVVTPHPDALNRRLEHLSSRQIIIAEAPTNDTWIRDYGPITTLDNDGCPTLNDFKFNAWGLKFAADKDNLVNSHLHSSGLFGRTPLANRLGFVLEGGSIESDGAGTLMTTSECLLSPNRNGDLCWSEIEQRLKEYFGVSHILRLDNGALTGDDTDSHIDTLARLAPHDTIVYCTCDDRAHPDYSSLLDMREEIRRLRTPDGKPYNLLELPLPDIIRDPDGEILPATYANFLIINNGLIVPSYGQSRRDALARRLLKVAFPDHEVVSVDCRALIRQHGSLHCATMQIPQNILPI